MKTGKSSEEKNRLYRYGYAHDSVDCRDIVTDTPREATKWDRIQKKVELGSVFQEHPGDLDDTGLSIVFLRLSFLLSAILLSNE